MKYTGKYGFVLIPSDNVSGEAKRISHDISNNELVFSGGKIPHVTLYHTGIAEFPEEKMHDLLLRLEKCLPTELELLSVSSVGSNYIFWNIKKTEVLERMHGVALELSAYFDPSKKQSTLIIEHMNEEERKNVARYGHPYVGALWKPHVTVGYRKNEEPYPAHVRTLRGTAVRVAFAHIVEYGQAVVVSTPNL